MTFVLWKTAYRRGSAAGATRQRRPAFRPDAHVTLVGWIRFVRLAEASVTVTLREQAAPDRRNYLVSFEKIRSHLGFQAETGLADGIREMARNFASGSYQNYRDEVYSNVATTLRAVETFYDPLESQRLYTPRRVG